MYLIIIFDQLSKITIQQELSFRELKAYLIM